MDNSRSNNACRPGAHAPIASRKLKAARPLLGAGKAGLWPWLAAPFRRMCRLLDIGTGRRARPTRPRSGSSCRLRAHSYSDVGGARASGWPPTARAPKHPPQLATRIGAAACRPMAGRSLAPSRARSLAHAVALRARSDVEVSQPCERPRIRLRGRPGRSDTSASDDCDADWTRLPFTQPSTCRVAACTSVCLRALASCLRMHSDRARSCETRVMRRAS